MLYYDWHEIDAKSFFVKPCASEVQLKNAFLIFNPTSNLVAINVNAFCSLTNNFSIFMMPLSYFYFFSPLNKISW